MTAGDSIMRWLHALMPKEAQFVRLILRRADSVSVGSAAPQRCTG